MRASKVLLTFTILAFMTNCANNPNHKNAAQKKAELYYTQGTSNLLQKDYTSALKNLLEANKLSPKDSKTHNNLGMAYYFRGDQKKALEHLKRSIELKPENSDARNNLASLSMEMGNLPEARKQYGLVLKDLIYKHQYRTHYNLALIDLKERKFREAKAKLLKSVQENEQYCPAYYQLGLMAHRNLEFRNAVDYFQKASLGSCVENPAPQYQQALSYIGLKDHEKALHKLTEIIERFPTSRYFVLAGQKLKEIKVDRFQAKNDKNSDRKTKMKEETRAFNF